jgi:transcriptional regulator with XRE-family HTH domain
MSSKIIQMETVGQIVRAKRESLGLLLRQVASYLDIDQAILSKIERNERKPTKDNIVKLAADASIDRLKKQASGLVELTTAATTIPSHLREYRLINKTMNYNGTRGILFQMDCWFGRLGICSCDKDETFIILSVLLYMI